MSRISRDPDDQLFRTLEDILRRLRALETRVLVGLPESEGWHNVGAPGEPAYQNGWATFGGPFPGARFYKDPFGVVHLDGLVTGGAGFPTTIFTLPPGYRPGLIQHAVALLSNNALARMDVQTNGNVVADTGSTFWFQLHFSFRAEQ